MMNFVLNMMQELYTLLNLMQPGCLGESNMFHVRFLNDLHRFCDCFATIFGLIWVCSATQEYYTKPFMTGQKQDATPAQKR